MCENGSKQMRPNAIATRRARVESIGRPKPAELAVGAAAINSINQVGGFLGPVLWGRAKDATGNYSLALSVMAASMLVTAGLILILRAQVAQKRARLALAVPA